MEAACLERVCSLLSQHGDLPGPIFGDALISRERYEIIKQILTERKTHIMEVLRINYANDLVGCIVGISAAMSSLGFLLRVYRKYSGTRAHHRFRDHLVHLRTILHGLRAVEEYADRTIAYHVQIYT